MIWWLAYSSIGIIIIYQNINWLTYSIDLINSACSVGNLQPKIIVRAFSSIHTSHPLPSILLHSTPLNPTPFFSLLLLGSQDKSLKDTAGSGIVEVLSANTTINVAVPDALIGSIFGKQVQNTLPYPKHPFSLWKSSLCLLILKSMRFLQSLIASLNLHHFSNTYHSLPSPLFLFSNQ